MNAYFTKFCAIAGVLVLLYCTGCRNPVISDNKNLLDFQSLNLGHIDSCTVYIQTVADKPLISSNVAIGVLGSMNDLFFGKTYASIYAQCLLGVNDPQFQNTIVDSAVLVMPFLNDSSKYGNCSLPLDIIVYELSQDMMPGDVYYTTDAFSVYTQPLGQTNNYVANLVDSFYVVNPLINPEVPTQNLSPQLRVRLSNSFANKLINTPDTLLFSSLSFIEYFKGLYITTNPNKIGNGLMYFALNNCAINLYYHHPAYTPLDTSVFQFQISTYGVTVNHFDHYYNGTLLQSALNSSSPTGNKYGYIQAGSGTKLKLTIPWLMNIDSVPAGAGKKAPIGVTKAELILPIVDTLLDDPSYHAPSTLALSIINDIDSTVSMSSYNNGGIGFLSTRFDDHNKPYLCYVFNLTEYIQRVFDGYFDNKNGYYVSYSYTVKGDRVIIQNDPSKYSTQCKLKITYTKMQ